MLSLMSLLTVKHFSYYVLYLTAHVAYNYQ